MEIQIKKNYAVLNNYVRERNNSFLPHTGLLEGKVSRFSSKIKLSFTEQNLIVNCVLENLSPKEKDQVFQHSTVFKQTSSWPYGTAGKKVENLDTPKTYHEQTLANLLFLCPVRNSHKANAKNPNDDSCCFIMECWAPYLIWIKPVIFDLSCQPDLLLPICRISCSTRA